MLQYTITPEEAGSYIIIKTVGDITQAMITPIISEAYILGNKLGINRYLFDVRESTNVDSVTNQYYFAYRDLPQNYHVNRTSIAAVLVNPSDKTHDFVITATNNAGFLLRKFTDLEAARKYLGVKTFSRSCFDAT